MRWPDFGCPDTSDLLLTFVRDVRAHLLSYMSQSLDRRKGPILIHCRYRTCHSKHVDCLPSVVHVLSILKALPSMHVPMYSMIAMFIERVEHTPFHACAYELLYEDHDYVPIQREQDNPLTPICMKTMAMFIVRESRTQPLFMHVPMYSYMRMIAIFIVRERAGHNPYLCMCPCTLI